MVMLGRRVQSVGCDPAGVGQIRCAEHCMTAWK
jgi:hypothetical protein